jgi:hypothetical protein
MLFKIAIVNFVIMLLEIAEGVPFDILGASDKLVIFFAPSFD